ncbi:putative cytochrome P450 [Pseudomassariella vexata]|uniref:Putative cytochrome P450 n=1 Tax=Pseudomassariella vexata TaxID=1141098 RepID=A0A1Y2EBW7_9PEZI|nr:putative cytochrome P450 [Pseudomassariella vexata]ORY69073.1 putative cytochrome P450 [Pseudomassariella vexata]
MLQFWPLDTTHLDALFLYNIVYRAFFHPLAKYPGPLLSKFTNLYSAYHAWKGDIHLDVLRCHQKYGDRVRYAPNRVLINSPEALRDIYGHGAHVRKFDGYMVLSSQAVNTLTMSDKAQHARRRRVISQAFSESSLRLFEPTIISRIDRFCQVIRGHASSEGKWTEPQDMAHGCKYIWILNIVTHLTFDLMTALSFDADYRTMEEPQFRYVVPAIEESNIRLSVLWQASELTFGHLDRKLLPRSARAARTFVKFLRMLLTSRLEQDKTGNRDIFSFLQQCKDPDTNKGLSLKELGTEIATFVVAGTDTSSTTMAALSHYLTGSARCYRRAAAEVRTTFASADEIRLGPKLNSCVFLRACMDEALRLAPPGGDPLWRVVEEDGAAIGGDFIPGGCEVGAGIYAMHHSPENWEGPISFTPERWLDKTGPRQPYFPFNIGPRSCVGKPLAIAQVTLTFARLLWEFDVRRADSVSFPGEGNDTRPTQYVLKDHVTGKKEGPVLCFRRRL